MNKLLTKLMGNAQINIAADCRDQGKLKTRQTLALSGEKGATLTCTSGVLWVTIEGEYADHLLGPNESIAMPARKKTVLGGLKGAGYCLATA